MIYYNIYIECCLELHPLNLPEDRGIFDFLVEQRTAFRLASVGNVVVSLCSVFAMWYFLYYDRRSKFDLSDHDGLPTRRVKAAVFPRKCFGYCDPRNI